MERMQQQFLVKPLAGIRVSPQTEQYMRGSAAELCIAGSHLAETLASLQQTDAYLYVPFSTWISLMKECGNAKALLAGRGAHGLCVRCGLEHDKYLGNLIVDMYGKCGSLSDARSTFNRIVGRNSISWNIMIAVYMQHRNGNKALVLFKQMQEEGVRADKFTYASVLSACSSVNALVTGRHVHASILEAGLELDSHISSGLVNMYGKFGSLEDASKLFSNLCSHDDAVTWNAMLTAYAQHGFDAEVLNLYEKMLQRGVKPEKVTFLSILGACQSLSLLEEGKIIHDTALEFGFESDILIATALVSMYSDCSRLEDAQAVFDRIQHHDVVSWSTMITVYTQHGNYPESVLLFGRMYAEGIRSDMVTFVAVFCACANLAALTQGQMLHADCIESGTWSDAALGNALINMYVKCGSLVEALNIFNSMCVHDVVSWTTMLEGYAYAGNAMVALELLSHMQQEGLAPNDVTFVNVLSACSHAGRLEEGSYYFRCISEEFATWRTIEHFASMVDMFGRAGRLDVAESVIREMPVPSNAVIWEALLSACRFHGDVERGKHAAAEAILSGSDIVTPYILLSNIFSAEGLWDEARKVSDFLEG